MIGIYKITTKHNNKFYIGSSNNIEKRFLAHLSKLKRNVHDSPYFQAVYNKYGIENLSFEIIHELEDENIQFEIEQYYLDLYKCYDRRIGYNVSKTAQCNTSGQKIIHKYDLEGYYIETFESIKEAQIKYKLNSISQALKGKNSKTCGGFQWKYEKLDKIDSLYKIYCCYDKNGDFFKSFKSKKEASLFFNFTSLSNITRAINENLTSSNYYWRVWNTKNFDKTIIPKKRKSSAKKVQKLDLKGNFIEEFDSVTDAAISIKVDVGNLSRLFKGNTKYNTCHGFKWKLLK